MALGQSSNISRLMQITKIILGSILEWMKSSLPFLIFIFKFLEWWYASEYHKQADSNPIPPPPDRIDVISNQF